MSKVGRRVSKVGRRVSKVGRRVSKVGRKNLFSWQSCLKQDSLDH